MRGGDTQVATAMLCSQKLASEQASKHCWLLEYSLALE